MKILAPYFPVDIAREANNDHQEMPYCQHDNDIDRELAKQIFVKQITIHHLSQMRTV